MNEVLAPGVSIFEKSFSPSSIQGVGTSTTGFIGITRNGPIEGPPRLVTSFGEFERLYGGLAPLEIAGLAGAANVNYLAMSVRGYFNEGGRRLYISRTFLPAGGTGHARAVLVGADNTNPRHLILRSRFPGSGTNATISVSEIATPATDTALANAPTGSLARSRGVAAEPAQATANAGPGAILDGTTLTIDVNGAGPQILSFSATPAVASPTNTVATTITIPDGTVLTLTLDGLTQAVPITAGIDRPRTEIRDEITAGLANGSCVLTGDRLTIVSSTSGTAVSISVSQLDILGFTDPQTTGTGTGLPRLDAVTAADVNGLLTAAAIDATADTVPGTQLLRISTNATGNVASLDLSDASNLVALTALGFDPAALAAAQTGTDGVTRRIFLREAAGPDGWREHTAGAAGVFTPAAALSNAAAALGDEAHIVTLAMSWTSTDAVTTSYEGLGLDETHPRYFGHRMITVTDPLEEPLGDPLVLEEDGLNAAEVHAALFAGGRSDEDDLLSNTIALTSGQDGTVPALQTMTRALDNLNLIDDIAIVAAPGTTAYDALGNAVRNAMIGHAEDSNFRIAVCDPPLGQEMAQLRRTRGQFDNTYAAFYAPCIRIANPLYRPGNDATRRELILPPSGHICGIYARNDTQRGVHKTPANEVIREAVGFERDYNQRHQEVLNPIGINILRKLTGRGNRVYGGRLATSDREIVYVSDRRYLNFLKHSIHTSMQWAVFEPNGPALWSDIREAVSSFLFNQWRNGALLGAQPDNAFFVRCDRSVITADDILNGRSVCEVGCAFIKPAEFLIFRIGQKTADSRS
ncbi:MAG: phage tail sheath protein FI [Ascidiaceihabitans sp.]|jgi:phage tail sheath protein FI